MKSMLSQLLFKSVEIPSTRGRQIKFDVDEPDILVATGSLDERIKRLLTLRGYPMSAREIAAGIASNASQVNRGLRLLIGKGEVVVIDTPGCVREYALKSR